MSPRPRKSGRRSWPQNLYANRKDGKTYYVYRHPQTGKRHGMGTDFAKAAQAARLLNAKLMTAKGAEDLVRQVMAEDVVLFADFVRQFRNEVLPAHRDRHGKPYASATLEDYQRRCGIIAEQEWAGKFVEDITRRDIAGFLDVQGSRTSNVYRHLLDKIFRHAIAKGLRDDNPVEATLKKAEIVQRQRLPYEAFCAIRDAAEPWFRNALDLALQTLQRREDLVEMRFDHIRDGHLEVRQQKVEKHGTGNIRIRIGPELAAVIARCRDDVPSPYLIHRRPKKLRREYAEKKGHWTKVAPEMLTREFQRLRDELGLFNHLPMEARPSFHEIRALGGDMYLEAGWTKEEVQALMGHSSAKMTEHYLAGHRIRWVEAKAGLPA